jgi:polyhydroxyalkanoate synthesis regulator phasin
MAFTERIWDALTTVIKMNDKVVATATTVKEQQARIEGLSERVARLEATIDLLIRAAENRRLT